MAVFRVNRTDNYTVMSNYHLNNKEMSLKAKGLLSLMLSLPEDWDYSVDGLVSQCKENETAISSVLKELKQFKYLAITKIRGEKGLFEYVYDIFERPYTDNPEVENPVLGTPVLDEPDMENHGPKLNTNIQNTNNKKENITLKEKRAKEIRHKHGVYGRVLLTEAEYDRLLNELGEERLEKQIELLDEYIESNNNKNKYTNFNLVLRKSIKENWFNNNRVVGSRPRLEKTNDPEWLKKYVDTFEEGVEDL